MLNIIDRLRNTLYSSSKYLGKNIMLTNELICMSIAWMTFFYSASFHIAEVHCFTFYAALYIIVCDI